jgi:hypothetical protein
MSGLLSTDGDIRGSCNNETAGSSASRSGYEGGALTVPER